MKRNVTQPTNATTHRSASYLRRFVWGAATIAIRLMAFAPAARATDGDLDPAFGNGGIVKTDFGHSTDIAYAVARQADGKLVVAETTYSDNDYTGEDFALIRYNADGTVDRTFGSNGKVTTDFPGLAAVISAISRPRGGHLGDRDPT